MVSDGLKQDFREKVLKNEELERMMFHPPYPERDMWLSIVRAFEAAGSQVYLVAYDDVQRGDLYENNLEEKYGGGQKEIKPSGIIRAVYDLNECHIVTEGMDVALSFTHDREVVVRGGREQINSILEYVGELENASEYLLPWRERGLNYEKNIMYEERPVEDIVKEKAEDEKTWHTEKLKRPENPEKYFKQLDKLMAELQKHEEVYYVQTHPKTSFKVPAQHIKHSHPTQRYLVASDLTWAIRLYFNREIALKGEESKIKDLVSENNL